MAVPSDVHPDQAETIIRSEIRDIFADVFQYTGDLQPATAHQDVPRWDSLRHVALIVALETAFGISMSMDEIQEITCVRDIHTVLARHNV